MRIVRRVRAWLKAVIKGKPGGILEEYVKSAPSAQNAVDIFKGEWASGLPLAGVASGKVPLFEDPRTLWFLSEIGGVSKKRVLELGPLEGAHSYQFLKSGAESIVAIEANTRAFLKCLIVKELLNLGGVNFLCGDFVEYLKQPGPRFDVGLSSGVLYHMRNPAELIELLSKRCGEHVLIWTHYYDHEIISKNPNLSYKFKIATTANQSGFVHELHRHSYLDSLHDEKFCGGSAPISHWMTRQGILDCLKFFGFPKIKINFEEPMHQHGPSLALVASR